MSKLTKHWILAMGLVIVAFVIGIYLQDLKHRESTTEAWKANRFNMARFEKIKEYTDEMNPNNWVNMRDSIQHQMDSLMILRFRNEMDSLNKVRETKRSNRKDHVNL